jgi:hypothetical protein
LHACVLTSRSAWMPGSFPHCENNNSFFLIKLKLVTRIYRYSYIQSLVEGHVCCIQCRDVKKVMWSHARIFPYMYFHFPGVHSPEGTAGAWGASEPPVDCPVVWRCPFLLLPPCHHLAISQYHACPCLGLGVGVLWFLAFLRNPLS